MDKKGYRRNVGIVLMNDKKELLVANRMKQKSAWQFPQGGLDKGETAEQALFREMKEELGLAPEDVKVLAQTKDWLTYEIPKRFQRRSLKHRCRGQHQRWFLLQLIADDSKIRLDDCEVPEFDRWRWVSYWEPLELVIEFKRHVYQEALEEFAVIVGQ